MHALPPLTWPSRALAALRNTPTPPPPTLSTLHFLDRKPQHPALSSFSGASNEPNLVTIYIYIYILYIYILLHSDDVSDPWKSKIYSLVVMDSVVFNLWMRLEGFIIICMVLKECWENMDACLKMWCQDTDYVKLIIMWLNLFFLLV